MPEEIMIAVTSEDENGQEVTSYVPLTEYDNANEVISALPEELVQAHSEFQRMDNLYSNAVKESKKYKQRAQTAESQLSQNNNDETEENTTPPQTQNPLDVEQLTAIIKKQVLADIQADNEAVTQRNQTIANLMTEHGLNRVPNAREILANSSNPEETAKMLGRSFKQFDSIDGGQVDVDSDGFKQGLYNRLGLPTD